MDIARIAFTILMTTPILILIIILLAKLASQLGKGSPKSGSARHADNTNGFANNDDTKDESKRASKRERKSKVSKFKHKKAGRDSKSER